MTPYPAMFPIEAVNAIIGTIKANAIVEDRVAFAKAVWEVLGYGLKVGLGDPTPFSYRSAPLLSDVEVIEALEQLKAQAAMPPGVVTGLGDLPWRTVLKWALTALAAIL